MKSIFHSGKLKSISWTAPGGRKYTALWLVLQTVYTLIQQNRTITQREVYYMHKFFASQSEADEAILDVGCLLKVPREYMNISSSTKGLFIGRLWKKENGIWRNYFENGASSITEKVLPKHENEIKSDAKFIIIIEKDGIFNRLSEDQFFHKIPSILVTGKGFPDLATRRLVRELSDILHIPVLGLCDCNPYGLSILLTYKFGSARMPIDSAKYSLELDPSMKQELTEQDIKKMRSLIKHPYVQSSPAIMHEVLIWSKCCYKVELEALHSKEFSLIGFFLAQQILKRNFI